MSAATIEFVADVGGEEAGLALNLNGNQDDATGDAQVAGENGGSFGSLKPTAAGENIQALNGEKPEKQTTLTPEVWDMESSADTIKEFYDPKLPPTYSTQMIIKPYTTYTKDQLTSCQGP